MTAVVAGRCSYPRATATAVALAGCAALLARPALAALPIDQTTALEVLFGLLLAAGVLWPVATPTARGRRAAPVAPVAVAVAVAVGVGIAAFLTARLVAGAHSAGPWTLRFVALNTFAAVAEEAFFRRFLFSFLDAHAPRFAVVGSAAAFAVVHVTAYGVWVLPIDLAAGLLFAWQRRVTGSWAVPAATHVLANILAVL